MPVRAPSRDQHSVGYLRVSGAVFYLEVITDTLCLQEPKPDKDDEIAADFNRLLNHVEGMQMTIDLL
jgi:hypothetical protein